MTLPCSQCLAQSVGGTLIVLFSLFVYRQQTRFSPHGDFGGDLSACAVQEFGLRRHQHGRWCKPAWHGIDASIIKDCILKASLPSSGCVIGARCFPEVIWSCLTRFVEGERKIGVCLCVKREREGEREREAKLKNERGGWSTQIEPAEVSVLRKWLFLFQFVVIKEWYGFKRNG